MKKNVTGIESILKGLLGVQNHLTKSLLHDIIKVFSEQLQLIRWAPDLRE